MSAEKQRPVMMTQKQFDTVLSSLMIHIEKLRKEKLNRKAHFAEELYRKVLSSK